jgi:hypothetical protein
MRRPSIAPGTAGFINAADTGRRVARAILQAMPELGGVLLVLVIAAVAVAVGLGFGIVIAPRLGRLVDRLDADDDEEPRDGTD